MTTTPLTEQQLDEYEAAARNAARIGSGIDPAAVLELAAEVRRQRTELAAAPDGTLRDRVAAALYESCMTEADAVARMTDAVLRALPEPPLSPDYEHPACGFHWHGKDGMDIPVRDGEPVCPRCELARVEKLLAHREKRCEELRTESRRRGRNVLEGSEKNRALEREIDGVRTQLGAEILRTGQAEAELRRLAAGERDEQQTQDGDLIDAYLRFLRGQGPEPDLTGLPADQREAIAGRFEIVRALADRDPELPPLDLDPVARRLGLLADEGQQECALCGHRTCMLGKPCGVIATERGDLAERCGCTGGGAQQRPDTETRTVKCSRAVLRQPHTSHGWQPQPGMDFVDCPGASGWEYPEPASAPVTGQPPADTGEEAREETVHGCPPDGSGLTSCCGRTPFELPRTDRISSEAPVTCKGAHRG